jgi:antirestriction protein ArdC
MYRHYASDVKRDLYAEVTDRIIEALEQGVMPWKKPWNDNYAGMLSYYNPVSGTHYSGVNVLLLAMFGADDPRFCTLKQANSKGWSIKRGSHGTPIIYFEDYVKTVEKVDEETGETVLEKVRIPVIRSYVVFNGTQVDGMPAWETARPVRSWNPIEKAETLAQTTGADIRHGGNRAFYSPAYDFIQVPVKSAFPDAHGFYATLLHELAHWTGGNDRIPREMGGMYGSPEYAREELRAEIASAFVASSIGINTDGMIQNNAAYLNSWIKALKDDKREIFRAASIAQKIADYLTAFAVPRTKAA